MLISASISVVLVTETVAPEFSVEHVVTTEAVEEVEEVDAGAAVPARATWWRRGGQLAGGSSLSVQAHGVEAGKNEKEEVEGKQR